MSTSKSEPRSCFICGTSGRTSGFVEKWPIAGLGEVQVGFRICSQCGLVLQDPAPAPAVLNAHYVRVSTMTVSGSSGDLPAWWRAQVDRQLEFWRVHQPRRTGKDRPLAVQIGSSIGYTLSRFREEGYDVLGIEPSADAARFASDHYGVATLVSGVENAAMDPGVRAELVVATHVLEHLRDPVAALARCRDWMADDGHLLLEVPVLEAPEHWPNGYFTFEHLQYFSRRTLSQTLHLAGFRVATEEVLHEGHNTDSPVIIVLASLAGSTSDAAISHSACAEEVARASALMEAYLAREPTSWAKLAERVMSVLDSSKRLAFFGAGIHTSQFLAKAPAVSARVEAIYDSDPGKWGEEIGPLKVSPPAELPRDSEWLVVISSRGHQDQIYEDIRWIEADHGVRVIKLYD